VPGLFHVEKDGRSKFFVVTILAELVLTFHNHVKNTLVKARRCKNMLTPILNSRSPVPLKTKIQIYLMYIRPLLTYATWGPCISLSNWNLIDSVQTNSIRTSAGLLSFVSNQNVRDCQTKNSTRSSHGQLNTPIQSKHFLKS